MTADDANAEQLRLNDARDGAAPRKKWGPYLSERQWGTVREADNLNCGGCGNAYSTAWDATCESEVATYCAPLKCGC